MRQKRMPFSNSRARACSVLSSVSRSNSVFRVSGRSFVRQTLRVTVDRSCSSVRKRISRMLTKFEIVVMPPASAAAEPLV